MRRLLLALALLPLPAAHAQGVTGLGDPAFTAPFTRALSGNDPTALKDLHKAAEAGNAAALLALPSVLHWMRPAFRDSKRLRRVNGVPVSDAAAALPAAADWADGDAGNDMDTLRDRSLRLLAAGETAKGAVLFMIWLNQTGGVAPPPADLLALNLTETHLALLLRAGIKPAISRYPAVGEVQMIAALKADRPGAWMAIAAHVGRHLDALPPDAAMAAVLASKLFYAAGIPQEEFGPKITLGAQAMRFLSASPPDPKTAAATLAFLKGTPDIAGYDAACRAACPDTAPACTAAALSTYGLYPGMGDPTAPYTALIPTPAFLATPRGIDLTLAAPLRGLDPALAAARLKTARETDACFAETAESHLP